MANTPPLQRPKVLHHNQIQSNVDTPIDQWLYKHFSVAVGNDTSCTIPCLSSTSSTENQHGFIRFNQI
jgi:hypothetical protein